MIGEKARVALATFALIPHNLLLLDEPSNHLDISTINALTNALKTFDGSVIVISHDKTFLTEFQPTHVITINNKCVILEERTLNDNDWNDVLNSRESLKFITKNDKNEINNVKNDINNVKNDINNDKNDIINDKNIKNQLNKRLKPKELTKLEEKITKYEKEMNEIDENMIKYGTNRIKLEELMILKEQLQLKLDKLYINYDNAIV